MKLEDLLFCETHEWVHIAEEGGAKIATVGISDFAVEQLSDLVYIELPQAGSEIEAGAEFAEVESVKAVSPLYSPVSGEIIEVNSQLADKLELLNDDPYGAGWILKIKVSDDRSLVNLMDRSAYEKQCAEEA